MLTTTEQLKPADRKPSSPKIARYTGEVVYIYAFDVAYDMTREAIRELFGQPVAQFAMDASKRSPKQLFFYKPQMVRLPPLERDMCFRVAAGLVPQLAARKATVTFAPSSFLLGLRPAPKRLLDEFVCITYKLKDSELP